MSARPIATCVVLLLVLGGSARAEPVPAELRARVEGLLGAYRAVTVAEWRALPPDAAQALESVARDRTALPTWRARALAALGVVRPSAAAPLVRQLAMDTTAPVVLRSAAVDGTVSVLGAAAREVLVPLLRDPTPAVRLRSAQALAGSGPAGCQDVAAEARTGPASDPVARTAARCEARLRETVPPVR
jgi:HEAT repeat protein